MLRARLLDEGPFSFIDRRAQIHGIIPQIPRYLSWQRSPRRSPTKLLLLPLPKRRTSNSPGFHDAVRTTSLSEEVRRQAELPEFLARCMLLRRGWHWSPQA